MIIFISIILWFATIYLYKFIFKRKGVVSIFNEIPSEKGLPIIGVLAKIEKPLCNYLLKIGQKHGPIFWIKFGMRDIVVLNTFKYIKEALVNSGDALSGRWKAQRNILDTKNCGLALIEGNVWAEQRSFVLKTLKEFGVGKTRSIEIIRDECVYLIEDLERSKGKCIHISNIISIYTMNVISKFIMNKRFSHGDPNFIMFINIMKIVVNHNDPIANLSLMFPFLENNEWLLKFIMWISSRYKLLDKCHNFFKREINEHMNKLDINTEGADLMDRFLIKQHQMKERNESIKTFTNFQLVRNAFELLMAGYDTISTTLEWGFLLMSIFQDEQKKVHEEIIDTIGKERFVTMGDRVSLNYTQAVIDEISRLGSVLPLSVLHRTLSDVNVKGYLIPKDTIVIPNLLACHLDPQVWEKPYEFYPEHFLSRDSNGKLKYQPREELIPFSMGKRQCLGESLARMELFIFFTTVLQRFHVSIANDQSDFDIFRSTEGIVRKPDDYEFTFSKRK